MKITHDEKHNVGYISFGLGKKIVSETIAVGEELNIDIAKDGSVIGIELLNANKQIGNVRTVEIKKSES